MFSIFVTASVTVQQRNEYDRGIRSLQLILITYTYKCS